MRRGIVISAALLTLAAQAWCHQDQSQSSQSQQPPAQQTQAQNPPPATHQDSLAEAARKAREQKKAKAAKVFTNDNIPTEGGINTVGEEAPARSEAKGKAGAGQAGTSSSSGSKEEKGWRDRFAKLHHKLSQDQAELDIMQRELGVLNVQYYSDPVKAMQQSISREDIDKKTADIEAKKKDVEADKQAIADAEDELRKSGGDAGWASSQ